MIDYKEMTKDQYLNLLKDEIIGYGKISGLKQIYENSKNNLRPNMKKEIERAIMKIDKIVSVQKKKFGNRILTFIPDPKQ
jgi:hypothetical protein